VSDPCMRTEPISSGRPASGNSSSADRLTFVGHATTWMRLDGTGVLTDPVLRGRIGPLRRQGSDPQPELLALADLALVSHLHHDHLDLPSLRRLSPDAVLVVPRGAGRFASRAGAAEVVELSIGEDVTIGGVTVTAVPAVHDSRRGPWGPRVQPVGYLLDSGHRRVYFAGDTDLFPQMRELGRLDLALLPVGGWGPTVGPGHMDPWRAALALRRLTPRLAVPIHWGTFYPLGLRRLRPRPLTDPPLEFSRFAAELAPESRVYVLAPGSGLDLDEAAEG
jgi:L-ascorbate metabolism protein UlaG (beta-lactamase superfamily)